MDASSHAESRQTSRWIWPFEVLEQIGEGGMGVVYRARYAVNGRMVALKMLPSDVNDATTLARFERELEVLKNLRHPNIVRCFGGVCENTRRFYAMELVEGGNLEQKLLNRGRLPWEQVVYYGLQMCAALEASHEKGVVHRDIKPANFLITESGQIKLSDFGLASVAAASKITAAGKTAGTFLYMAPEQIRGGEIVPQTDLYALGCVLFELLTGRAPFQGGSPAATLQMHCKAPPPRVTEIALDCPIALERIVLKLLEKDVERRYVSAAIVARELRMVTQTVKAVAATRSISAGDVADVESDGTRVLPGPTRVEETVVPPPVSTRPPLWQLASAGGLCALLLLGNIAQWSLGTSARTARTLWFAAAEDPDVDVRIAAMESLGQIGQRDRDAFDRLLEGLNDPEPRVRAAALNVLGTIPQGKRALATMLKMQNQDVDDDVRSAARAAIARHQSD